MPAFLRPYVAPETLRKMQRARHIEAVELLDGGDTVGFYRLMSDVVRFGEEIRLSLAWVRASERGTWQ